MEAINLDRESSQLLNQWLVNHLEPISDADPIVLAKYVIALLQNEMPEKYLRQKCLKQLDIFLGNETSSFVDLLFDTIKNKSYLKEANSGNANNNEDDQSKTSMISIDNHEGVHKKSLNDEKTSTSSTIMDPNHHQEFNVSSEPSDTTSFTEANMVNKSLNNEQNNFQDNQSNKYRWTPSPTIEKNDYVSSSSTTNRSSVQTKQHEKHSSSSDINVSSIHGTSHASSPFPSIQSFTISPSTSFNCHYAQESQQQEEITGPNKNHISESSRSSDRNSGNRVAKRKSRSNSRNRHFCHRRHLGCRKYSKSSDSSSSTSDSEDDDSCFESDDSQSTTESDRGYQKSHRNRRKENRKDSQYYHRSSAKTSNDHRTCKNDEYHNDKCSSNYDRSRNSLTTVTTVASSSSGYNRVSTSGSSSRYSRSTTNHHERRYHQSSSNTSNRYQSSSFSQYSRVYSRDKDSRPQNRSRESDRNDRESSSRGAKNLNRTTSSNIKNSSICKTSTEPDNDDSHSTNENTDLVPKYGLRSPSEKLNNQEITDNNRKYEKSNNETTTLIEEADDHNSSHDHECPEIAEKGFCEKGLYCPHNPNALATQSDENSLTTNDFFMEPYNPEAAPIDPLFFMQFTLPNALLGRSNSNEADFMMKMMKKRSGELSQWAMLNQQQSKQQLSINSNQPRQRELVGMPVTGDHSGGDYFTMEYHSSQNSNNNNNRWTQHQYHHKNNRYSNQTRENNIDLLAASSSHENSNSRNDNKNRYIIDDSLKTYVPTGISEFQSKIVIDGDDDEQQTDDRVDRMETVNNNDDNSLATIKEKDSKTYMNMQTMEKMAVPNWLDKSTLIIRKIPKKMNTISHLNKHFSKYGTVVYIQVCYQNDPEAALVKYMNHFEATKAIRSTEAVFNNRFIKVYWAHSQNNNNAVNSKKSSPMTLRNNNNKKRRVMASASNDDDFLETVPQKVCNDNEMMPQSNRFVNYSRAMVTSSYLTTKAINEDHLGLKKLELSSNNSSGETPLKTISSAERFKHRNLLVKYNQSLEESMINQKHFLKKLQQAKSEKEKTAIMKLIKSNIKNIDDLKEKILKSQEILKPSLQTTKINNISNKYHYHQKQLQQQRYSSKFTNPITEYHTSTLTTTKKDMENQNVETISNTDINENISEKHGKEKDHSDDNNEDDNEIM